MTTAIGRKTTTATTTTGTTTTIAAVKTIAETTTTVATTTTIGTMIIIVMIIATTSITPTDGTQEITKGSTSLKMCTRTDRDHPTTIAEGHAPHRLNLHYHNSSTSDNWCR